MHAVIEAGSFTDADLIRIGNTNPEWRVERTDRGALIMSPTTTPSGPKSAEALVQPYVYAKSAGGKVYGAQTGFKTPLGGVVSPDAAWLRAEHVARYAGEDAYWQTMPDIAIEVASKTDDWPTVKAKNR